MTETLRAFEMVEGTTLEEAAVMRQQRRIEEAQRLRRQMQMAQHRQTEAGPDLQ